MARRPSELPPPATSLDPFSDRKKGEVNVVIEATRGTRNKYKYDEETRLFKLSKVLPSGCAFPLDFGFVPGTRGEDGDPLDILLFSDEPLVVGTLLPARLLGVFEAVQKEDGKTERNDRIVGVGMAKGQELQGLKTLKNVPKVKI